MAKDKKWVDCPSCGSIGTMKFSNKKTFEVKHKELGDVKLNKLSGYFCKKCDDGFFTIKSENTIEAHLAELQARKDADKVKASDLILVEDLARKWKKTKQYIHKLMNEGKIHYVYIGKLRFPRKEELNRSGI